MFITRKELKIDRTLERVNEMEDNISILINSLMVIDDIIEYETGEKRLISKFDAIDFKYKNIYNQISTGYTTKENYENHKPLIDKWEKEAKK